MDKNNHLIIGIGGTGGNIIKAFRKRIFINYRNEERNELPIEYIYIDSSKEMMSSGDPTWRVLGENTQLGKDSQLFIRSASLKNQLDSVDNYPGIKNWIGDRRVWDNLVGNIADDGAAAQRRRLGRFLFSCSIHDFHATVNNKVKALQEKTGNVDVTFHVVAGLAGGTGSGSIVDTITQIRNKYKSSGSNPKFKIFTYLLVPEENPKPGWDKGFYHANGFAALTELNALSIEKFKPHDISGVEERVDNESKGDNFNAAYLFTNVNENGVIVDTKEDLPEIVSDFIHHKISLADGKDAKKIFERHENFENIDDWKEYDERSEDSYSKLPVRSKKFHSFGIKRIIVPEEEITEYLSYQFSLQALYQFKYNNWSEDFGFTDQPRNEDYHSYVNDRNRLNKWLLTDEHLMLSIPVLESDRKHNWKNIRDDWDSLIPILKERAWQQASSNTSPLTVISKACDDRFEKKFRKIGVREFYRLKSLSKKDIAKEIANQIEKHVFSEWSSGQLSVYDINKLTEVLVAQLEDRLSKMDDKIQKFEDEIDKQINHKQKLEHEWSSTGIIKDLLGKKKKIFEGYATVMQLLYTNKTFSRASVFAKELLAEVINQVRNLQSEISHFSEKVNYLIETSQKVIDSRLNDDKLESDDFKEAIVRFYDNQKVIDFQKQIVKEESVQKNQAADLRKNLIKLLGEEQNFTLLNKNLPPSKFEELMELVSIENAKAAHNEFITVKRDKVIGTDIIEKLYEKYGTDETALKKFVNNIVKYSGTFLSFDNSEISRDIKNNNIKPGTNTKLDMCLIEIPGSDEYLDFIEKLKNIFRGEIEGSKTVLFDTKSDKLNEISIISMTSCFPLRVVGNTKYLKQKYNYTLKKGDEEINRLVLHLEGDGTQYPRITLPDQEELKREREQKLLESLPYYLLSLSMGVVDYQELGDGTGKKQYAYTIIDDGIAAGHLTFGNDIVSFLDSFNENNFNQVKEDVINKLSSDYLHIEKRNELVQGIPELLNNKVLPKCKGANDPKYQMFYKAYKNVKDLIK